MPRSLCDITVPPRLTEKLLVAGKELHVRLEDKTLNKSFQHCWVSVDGEEVLSVSREWHSGRDIPQVVALQSELDVGSLRGEDDFQYGERGAVKRVVCRHPRQEDWSLFVITQVRGSQEPTVSEIKRFTATYAKAVEKSKQCDR
ncbi:hypothetical protein DEH18_32715 [Streptomyces sp. NHF165]|nr:hypothetical protein DEH18_32715 [Streptomyces sp. NHF165]